MNDTESNKKKIFTDPQYDDTPISKVHPVMRKYHLSFGDIRRYSHDIGVAPPVLFGIVTGTTLGGEEIKRRLGAIFDIQDVQKLYDDYNPYRHMLFVGDENIAQYNVFHNRIASLIEPGDAIRTDDNRWLIITDIQISKRSILLFSQGFFVARIHKDSRLIMATPVNDKGAENMDDTQAKKRWSVSIGTQDFFEGGVPQDENFATLYRDITKVVEG